MNFSELKGKRVTKVETPHGEVRIHLEEGGALTVKSVVGKSRQTSTIWKGWNREEPEAIIKGSVRWRQPHQFQIPEITYTIETEHSYLETTFVGYEVPLMDYIKEESR